MIVFVVDVFLFVCSLFVCRVFVCCVCLVSFVLFVVCSLLCCSLLVLLFVWVWGVFMSVFCVWLLCFVLVSVRFDLLLFG